MNYTGNYDLLPDAITDRMVTIIGLPGKCIKALVYEHTGHTYQANASKHWSTSTQGTL